jgi:hypothetical protein
LNFQKLSERKCWRHYQLFSDPLHFHYLQEEMGSVVVNVVSCVVFIIFRVVLILLSDFDESAMFYLSLFYDFIKDFELFNIECFCVGITTVCIVQLRLLFSQDILIPCVIQPFFIFHVFSYLVGKVSLCIFRKVRKVIYIYCWYH